jgi:hypothetical protein
MPSRDIDYKNIGILREILECNWNNDSRSSDQVLGHRDRELLTWVFIHYYREVIILIFSVTQCSVEYTLCLRRSHHGRPGFPVHY